MSQNFSFAPRLMPAATAAHYLGISASKLRGLSIPRRICKGNKLYDIRDLDNWADNLPIEGEQEWHERQEQLQADRAFGIAAE